MTENEIGTVDIEPAIAVYRELKSVEKRAAAHKKQVQTYLRLTGGIRDPQENTDCR